MVAKRWTHDLHLRPVLLGIEPGRHLAVERVLVVSHDDHLASGLGEGDDVVDLDPVARVYAVFDAQAEILAQPNFRGCAFISASAEAPPGGVIEHAVDAYRAELRELFTSLAADTGVADPATLGRQLHLIYDGAILSAQIDHDPSIAVEARAAVAALLTTALPSNDHSTPLTDKRSHQDEPRSKKERR